MNNKKKEAYQCASKFIVLNPAWTAPSTASGHDPGYADPNAVVGPPFSFGNVGSSSLLPWELTLETRLDSLGH